MIKTKNQEKNKFILTMKFITIFIFLFVFFNSTFAVAKIEDCEIIKDELKKKNCVINNKAQKLKTKIKEKSSDIKEKISSDIKPTLEKHKKFQKESPKTLWDLFKKIKN